MTSCESLDPAAPKPTPWTFLFYEKMSFLPLVEIVRAFWSILFSVLISMTSFSSDSSSIITISSQLVFYSRPALHPFCSFSSLELDNLLSV